MYSISQCQLCSGTFTTNKGSERRICSNNKVKNSSETCWKNENNAFKNEILNYLSNTKLKPRSFNSIADIVRNIDLTNDLLVSTSLQLLDTSSLRLLKSAFPFESIFGKQLINEEYRRGDSDKVIYKDFIIPDDLPNELKEVANNYYQYLKTRLDKLTNNGRPRDTLYLSREMSNCMPFLRYLASKGIKTWSAYTDDHLTNFLADNNKVINSKIKRFIKYQNNKNPFFNNRGYHKKKNGSVLIEKPLCKVMSKLELAEFIDIVKTKYSKEYYLIAWLITHFGISYLDATNVTLDKFKISDSGEIQFKPNEVWVRLPTSIQKTLLSIAKNFTGNILLEKEYLKQVNIFDLSIRTSNRVTQEIFRGKVTLLRHTAIYNMLCDQKLDRKTISYISGVSMKTIENVESLLSVTHNISLPADFVQKRNALILGKE